MFYNSRDYYQCNLSCSTSVPTFCYDNLKLFGTIVFYAIIHGYYCSTTLGFTKHSLPTTIINIPLGSSRFIFVAMGQMTCPSPNFLKVTMTFETLVHFGTRRNMNDNDVPRTIYLCDISIVKCNKNKLAIDMDNKSVSNCELSNQKAIRLRCN